MIEAQGGDSGGIFSWKQPKFAASCRNGCMTYILLARVRLKWRTTPLFTHTCLSTKRG